MATGTYNVNVGIGGINMSKIISRTGDHPNPYEPSIPAASAGTIVNRTNNTLTDVTLLAGHGLTNGTYACFFSTGVAYACVGEITANVLTLNVALGDAFPVNTTACQVAKITTVNTAIDGDAITLIGMMLDDTNGNSTKVAHVRFLDTGSAQIAEIDLVANAPRVWDITGGDANAFTGNPITSAQVAQNDTTSAHTVYIASLEDSTP